MRNKVDWTKFSIKMDKESNIEDLAPKKCNILKKEGYKIYFYLCNFLSHYISKSS